MDTDIFVLIISPRYGMQSQFQIFKMREGTQSTDLMKSAKEIQANIIISAEDKPRLLPVQKNATESCVALRSTLLCNRQNDSVMFFFVVTNVHNI